MNSNDSSMDVQDKMSQSMLRKPQTIKVIQIFSWMITGIFLAYLAVAIYQGLVNGNPLPLWAWLGLLVVIAVIIGLAVLFVVYRGVSKGVGAFDNSSTDRVTGELKNEVVQVDAGETISVRAEIKMTAGVLQVMGGTPGVLNAVFTYDDADWKRPEVNFQVDPAGQGELMVKQAATHRPAMRQGCNEWEMRLNKDLPTYLDVQFGAGKATLNLSGMNITGLDLESGVGELTVDLSGELRRSLKATVRVGIGDTVLRVPQNAGVRVQSAVSLGSIRPEDLTWDGEAYTNAFYGQSPIALDVTVMGGMGKLTIE